MSLTQESADPGAAGLPEAIGALGSRFVALVESGRVLSAKNEACLRRAKEELEKVLSAIEKGVDVEPQVGMADGVLAAGYMESAVSETTFDGDIIPLQEGAVRKDGTIDLKLIRPGRGSSGFYKPETLERDGAKVFKKGLHMHWDHPTEAEEIARPERSLSTLAAVLEEDAHWKQDHPKGPGLYARAKVFDAFRKPINDLAEHIGVSIRASGRVKHQEMDGASVPVVEQLVSAKSVDFVTLPGAGGEILSLFEAARPSAALPKLSESARAPAAGPQPQERDAMSMNGAPGGSATNTSGESDQNLVESLNLKVTGLRTENKALETALSETRRQAQEREANLLLEARNAQSELAVYQARDFVRKLAEAKDVPKVLMERQMDEIPRALQLKEGKLDEEALRPLIEKRIREDMEFWAKATRSGDVRGLGGSGVDIDPAKIQESLTSTFKALGLSETAASYAVQGRGR